MKELNKSVIKLNKFEKLEDMEINLNFLSDYHNKITNIYEKLPTNFKDKLKYLRISFGLTREQLSQKTYINAHTIKEMEESDNVSYKLDILFTLCIGLNLPPDLSFDLLESAGFFIEDDLNTKQSIYSYILKNLYDKDIHYINEILRLNGIK